MDSPDLALKVAGGSIELLALPLIHMGPNDVSIRAVKLGVDIDQGLDIIVAGRHVGQAVGRVTQYVAINKRWAPRRELIDINAKEGRLPVPDPAWSMGSGVAFLARATKTRPVIGPACTEDGKET